MRVVRPSYHSSIASPRLCGLFCAFPPQKRRDSSIYIIVPPIALVLSGPRSDANCFLCLRGNSLFFACGTAEKRAVMKTTSV